MRRHVLLLALIGLSPHLACERPVAESPGAAGADCELVRSGSGPIGDVDVRAEVVVAGLEVPWGLAFLPGGDLLVTERPGRIRLVRNGQLVPSPVASLDVSARAEGGLLGIVLHPEFDVNRFFFVYYTADLSGGAINRVERWTLSQDAATASPDRVIIDDIPAARFHNGGRMRFGPDGNLYVGTGDAGTPRSSQQRDQTAGKILRLTPDGEIPGDNPFPNNPAYITGIRNTQGFDWSADGTLWVTDHGPSGEMGRRGHDEVNIARPGDNLGWPDIYGCQERNGMVAPALTWREAVPPGGAAFYTGSAIPEWSGSLIIGTLGSQHLHRVVPGNGQAMSHHEVYFQGNPPGGFGRLREVIMGPDGHLYVTTSNCDGRGDCPPDRDRILRIIR
jgi:aldose sugar dehydrogenase